MGENTGERKISLLVIIVDKTKAKLPEGDKAPGEELIDIPLKYDMLGSKECIPVHNQVNDKMHSIIL